MTRFALRHPYFIIVVCLMVYAILGLGADWLVRSLEARALVWRPSIVEN